MKTEWMHHVKAGRLTEIKYEEVTPGGMEFSVYIVKGGRTDENGVAHPTIEEDQKPHIHGHLSFTGCFNYTFSDEEMHSCGTDDLKALVGVFSALCKKGKELGFMIEE
jgi:hypothetical protein